MLLARLSTLSSGALPLFIDPAPTEIYPLSLHDALPIFEPALSGADRRGQGGCDGERAHDHREDSQRAAGLVVPLEADRKSTRLNSSHLVISYAVFCLKKKNIQIHCVYFYTPNNEVRVYG